MKSYVKFTSIKPLPRKVRAKYHPVRGKIEKRLWAQIKDVEIILHSVSYMRPGERKKNSFQLWDNTLMGMQHRVGLDQDVW